MDISQTTTSSIMCSIAPWRFVHIAKHLPTFCLEALHPYFLPRCSNGQRHLGTRNQCMLNWLACATPMLTGFVAIGSTGFLSCWEVLTSENGLVSHSRALPIIRCLAYRSPWALKLAGMLHKVTINLNIHDTTPLPRFLEGMDLWLLPDTGYFWLSNTRLGS